MSEARDALQKELVDAEQAADSAMKLIKDPELWGKIQANTEYGDAMLNMMIMMVWIASLQRVFFRGLGARLRLP